MGQGEGPIVPQQWCTEESNLWTAWQLFPLDDDKTFDFKDPVGDRVGVELLYNWVELGAKAVASRIPDSRDQMW